MSPECAQENFHPIYALLACRRVFHQRINSRFVSSSQVLPSPSISLPLCLIRSGPAAGAKGFPFIHSCRPTGWRFLSPHPPLSGFIPNLFPCMAAVPLFRLKEPNHNHRSAYNGKQIYEYRFDEISPILAHRLPPYWGKKSSHVNPASKKIFLLQYCPQASILQCLPWSLILQFFPPTIILQFFPPTIILFHIYPSFQY